MSLKTKLLLCFLSFSMLIFMICIIFYNQLKQMVEPLTTSIPHSVARLIEVTNTTDFAYQILYYQMLVNRNLEDYVFTQNPSSLRDYYANDEMLSRLMEKAKRIYPSLWKKLTTQSQALALKKNQVLNLMQNGNAITAKQILTSSQFSSSVLQLKNTINNFYQRYSKSTTEDASVAIRLAQKNIKLILEESLSLTLVISSITVVITLLLTFIGARIILRPLKLLSDDMKRMSIENLDVPINPQLLDFKGEIGVLTHSFVMLIKKLRSTTKNLQLLFSITDIATETNDFETALQRCLNVMCASLDWPIGHIYLPKKDNNQILIPSDIWFMQEKEKIADFYHATMQTTMAVGKGLVGRISSTGQPAWIENINLDSNFTRNKISRFMGINSASGFPIIANGQTIAVVEFFTFELKARDEELMQSFRIFGEQLSRVFERQQIQKALQQGEERSRLLLIIDKAREAYIAIDEKSCILEWNKQAELTFGWKKTEVTGKSLIETIIPSESQDIHISSIAHDLATGEGPIFNERTEITVQRKNGERFPIELSIASIQFDNKRFFSAFLYDITERKLTEQKLQDTLTSLTNTNSELEQFAYIASHDLRAPLRGIANLTGWIKEDSYANLSETSQKYLDLVEKRVHRLDALITGILEYSRAGRVNLETEKIDLNHTLMEVIDTLSSGHIKIIIDNTMPTILANKIAISQVFLNLVSNAIKYHDKPKGQINIGCRKCDKFYEFYVADDGPGIDPQFHEKIFKIFQTLQSRDSIESTGIGLTIVKKIIERQGGEIWVKSAFGKGSIFYFTWPIDLMMETGKQKQEKINA